MLTVRQLALSAMALVVLAAASYAGGAPAAEIVSLSPSAIQINPERPNIVYASTLGDDTRPGGVFKSTDAGKTWRLANTGLTVPPESPPGSQVRVDALVLEATDCHVSEASSRAPKRSCVIR